MRQIAARETSEQAVVEEARNDPEQAKVESIGGVKFY